METRSIHVPASVVQRLIRVATWVLPSAATIWSLFVFGVRWVGDIATQTWVAAKVADVTAVAKSVQSESFRHEQVIRGLQHQNQEAFRAVVRVRAELEVYRRFPRADTKTTGDLIDDAQVFYVRWYDAQLRERGGDATEAATKTFELYRWKPPR